MTRDLLHLDGALGEGGGQILRTALALSVVTGRPFRIERIRARRPKPGLMRQHLTAVRAAAAISGADVAGAAVGATSLEFAPGAVRAGDHHFAIGTAGSTTLVLQTILPALLAAPAASTIVLEGGTHNLHAPSVHFLRHAFLPLLERMGAGVDVRLERHGFFPAGGGRIVATVAPGPPRRPLELLDRGPITHRRAVASVAQLDVEIARRELAVVRDALGWPDETLEVDQVDDGGGPGNALSLEIGDGAVTEVFTGFGERGVSAETVAQRAVAEARAHLASGAPVGPHLADQLMLPLALAGGGRYRTSRPTPHATTNAMVVERFLPVSIDLRAEAGGAEVVVTPA